MHYDFIPNDNPSGIPTFQNFQEKLGQLVPPSGPILPGSHTWANLGKGAGTYSHISYLKSVCSVQIHLRPWWCHDSKTNYPYYADKLAFSVQIVFIVGLFDFQKHHQVLHFFVKKLLSFIFRLSFESHPAPDLDAPAGWKENKSLFLQKHSKLWKCQILPTEFFFLRPLLKWLCSIRDTRNRLSVILYWELIIYEG